MFNRLVLIGFLAFLPLLVGAQDTTQVSREERKATAASLDEKINEAFKPTADIITSIIFYSVPVSSRTDYYSAGETNEYYLKMDDSVAYKKYDGKVRYRPAKKMQEEITKLVAPAMYRVDTLYMGLAANTTDKWDTIAAAAFAVLPETSRKMQLDSVETTPAQYEKTLAYLVQIDSATYAASGDKAILKKVPAQFFTASPAYKLTADKMTGTTYSIQYVDAETYLISYTFSKEVKEGDKIFDEVYNVSLKGHFGKEYQMDGMKFTVDKVNADAKTPVFTVTPKPIKVPLVLMILIGVALFATFFFVFPNIRLFGVSIRTVQGKYSEKAAKENKDLPDTIRDESQEGEVSHFQALTAALSGTVGLGNIAGVAIAISLGGPGATFWMMLAGFLGMSAKFAECTLGVRYRDVVDGTVHGGPMYYLKKGLAERKMAGLGRFLAAFFALMCVGGSFGGGNMFQANQAAAQFKATFGIESGAVGVIFGAVMMAIVAMVLIGGIKRIGNVTEKLVPAMAVLYVGTALIILGMNIGAVPSAFGLIFEKAFSPDAATGGFVGVMLMGFQRAAFSNEAAVGSAAIAHSAVRTQYPASEGIVALLEPFIDTVIICTITALVLIVTDLNYDFIDYGTVAGSGSQITTIAFEASLPGSSYLLAIAVILFALSTQLSWSYYGLQAWKYVFGKGKMMDLTYKVLFCLFGVVGAAASLGAVVDFSDAMIFAMVFPNAFAIILLAPKVKEEVRRYLDYVKSFKKS